MFEAFKARRNRKKLIELMIEFKSFPEPEYWEQDYRVVRDKIKQAREEQNDYSNRLRPTS